MIYYSCFETVSRFDKIERTEYSFSKIKLWHLAVKAQHLDLQWKPKGKFSKVLLKKKVKPLDGNK